MAVLDSLEGIEVTVCVDGQALRDYNDDEIEAKSGPFSAHQASKTVSKYIEATTGKEFSIKIVVRDLAKIDCPALNFQVNVDGMRVSCPLLLKSRYGMAHF